jgi:hypothetical protein
MAFGLAASCFPLLRLCQFTRFRVPLLSRMPRFGDRVNSHPVSLRIPFANPCMMSIIGCLLQRGPDLFYSDCFSAIFSANRRLPICFVADPYFLPAPWHLTAHLIFSSLRLIRPGCCMPFDSFMHFGFQYLFMFLLLRVKNFCSIGVRISLLLRSSISSPGPVTMISSGEIKLQHSAT